MNENKKGNVQSNRKSFPWCVNGKIAKIYAK